MSIGDGMDQMADGGDGMDQMGDRGDGMEQMGDSRDFRTEPRRSGRTRADAVSLVVGVLFMAVALLALADRLWADIDGVLVAGGVVAALGVAMIVGAFLRHRRRVRSCG